MGMTTNVAFISAFAIVGYCIIGGGIIEGIVELELSQGGVQANAKITRKESTAGGDGTGSNKIYYIYKDAAEHPHSGAAQVSDEEYEKDQVGDVFPIFYVHDSPDTSRRNKTGSGWWLICLMGVPFAALGTYGVRHNLWKAAREKNILRKGTRTLGTLISVEKDSGRESPDQCFMLYSFTDSSGTPRHAKSDFFFNTQETHWRQRIGKHVVVYYLAEKPSENVLQMEESRSLLPE
jgi:hypothetical protein